MSNYKTVFFTLVFLQIILGLSMIVPILVNFFYKLISRCSIVTWIIHTPLELLQSVIFESGKIWQELQENLDKKSGINLKNIVKYYREKT